MCFQTVKSGRSALQTRGEQLRSRTYVLEAKKLVAAVAAQRPRVDEQLLQRSDFRRIGVLLDGRDASYWADGGLRGSAGGIARAWRARILTAPDLIRLKKPDMVSVAGLGHRGRWGGQGAGAGEHAARTQWAPATTTATTTATGGGWWPSRRTEGAEGMGRRGGIETGRTSRRPQAGWQRWDAAPGPRRAWEQLDGRRALRGRHPGTIPTTRPRETPRTRNQRPCRRCSPMPARDGHGATTWWGAPRRQNMHGTPSCSSPATVLDHAQPPSPLACLAPRPSTLQRA